MTDSLHLTYDLKIRARKVYINKPLLMEMKMEKFKSEQKHHTVFSKQFQFKAKLYIPSTYYKHWLHLIGEIFNNALKAQFAQE